MMPSIGNASFINLSNKLTACTLTSGVLNKAAYVLNGRKSNIPVEPNSLEYSVQYKFPTRYATNMLHTIFINIVCGRCLRTLVTISVKHTMIANILKT